MKGPISNEAISREQIKTLGLSKKNGIPPNWHFNGEHDD
jgi:hypothetical protein